MGRDARISPFNKWKQAEAVSTTQIYDRLGRLIQTGDVVHILNKTDVFWKVTGCAPVMDPTAPPGLVQVQLVAVFSPSIPGGQRVTDLVKVQDVSEFPPQMPALEEAPNGAGAQGEEVEE